MTVNRTTLLDLPLPVTGTESGTWGDTTNNGLTQYLDIAIAGTLVLSTDADVTLTSTEGDSSATNIGATTAQYAILRWTATGSTTRNITALAQSKTYVVINATGGTQSIVLRGAGPTTGVTIISGEKAFCVWNGSDFVKVSSSAAAGGSNTQVQYNSSGVLAGSSNMTFNGTKLTVAGFLDSALTSGRVPYATTSGELIDSANLLYSGTDLTVYGLTVGRGAGAVSTNTAVGASALGGGSQTGTLNTAVGWSALAANSSGSANSAFGRAALFNNTTGNDQVAVGVSALAANTTGSSNTAVGSSALQANTTASNNTAVGYQAGYSNTTGARNAFFGYTAGYSNTTAFANSAFGDSALYSNTTGAGNNAFGYFTLYANTTGVANTAIGGEQYGVVDAAMRFNTTGSYNTAVGVSALKSNTTASNNTAVGYQAGYSLTTGDGNTFIGHTAGYTATTSTVSTGVGRRAAYSLSTGQVTAVGYAALENTTTSIATTGLGVAALRQNTTGQYNTAIGDSALQNNTTASNNTAVGYQAGYTNSTGAGQTFLGYRAGYNATGNNNVIVGSDAGSNAALSGNDNVLVGQGSGYALTSGARNTFVGGGYYGVSQGSGSAVTTGSANTILGHYTGNQGGLDIRTSSNYVVLSDGDGNPRLYSTNSGQVFIPGDNGARPVEIGGGVVKVKGESGGWEIGYRFGDQSNNNVGAINATGANNSLSFIYIAAGGATSSSSAARFTANGIGLGTTSPATSGVGITFPATQSASSDANTLDDYEEGSFSPTIATSGANVTYTQQAGNYTKVGRLVTFGLTITLNTVTSAGSGDFEIGGLPFASSSSDVNQTRLVIQTNGVDFDATAYDFYAYIPTTSVSILKVLYSYDNGAWGPAQASNFVIAAGDLIVVTGFYYTTT